MDYTLLDYIRVTYHRRYRARANTLTFSADAGQQVAVAGFTDAGIRVIDITGDVASHEVRGRVSRDGAEWKVTLAVPGTGPRTLLAVATGAEASPEALRANVPSTLHQAGQAGDIVMIAPAAFQAALAPLKAFREGQGYTVRLVDIEDVYDEFSFGAKTPQAIKDFLVRATAAVEPPAALPAPRRERDAGSARLLRLRRAGLRADEGRPDRGDGSGLGRLVRRCR